jgi:3-deoxy-7-phosphoheptulonate synthase
MIIILKSGADDQVIDTVAARVRELGLSPHISKGEFRTIIGAIGEEKPDIVPFIEEIVGVERVVQIMKPFKLASRDFHPHDSVFQVGPVKIGAGFITIIAGPCAIESEELLLDVGQAVKAAGAGILRGGAYKPRTSPYAFQGLGVEGLKILRAVGDQLSIPVVTEVMDPRDVDVVERYSDIIQIGARNMQNYNLLQEVGKTQKPVFLKRGLAAPIKEWLMSAEYILAGGNEKVILCERGIRTFSDETRFTLDISAVPVVKEASHLPIFVDPSHSGGRRDLVAPLTLAALAAGADGVMIEVHSCPDKAKCDGPQAMFPAGFHDLMHTLRQFAQVLKKTVSSA